MSEQEGNRGPELIKFQSNRHATSFEGSGPMVRAHFDDNRFSAYFSELGMPTNKIDQKIDISQKIKSLPDKYFFACLAGPFATDGCFTRQNKMHLHFSFDVHSKTFCDDVANQIEHRLGLKINVQSHFTNKIKEHFKIIATTNCRSLPLLLLVLFYAPYHLERKIKKAQQYINDLIEHLPSYRFLRLSLSEIAEKRISFEELQGYVTLIRSKAKY